jgi:hypothetical protein
MVRPVRAGGAGGLLALSGEGGRDRGPVSGLRGSRAGAGARRSHRAARAEGDLHLRGHSHPGLEQESPSRLKPDQPLPVGRAREKLVGLQGRGGGRATVARRQHGRHGHTPAPGAAQRPLCLLRGQLLPAVCRKAPGGDPQQPLLGPHAVSGSGTGATAVRLNHSYASGREDIAPVIPDEDVGLKIRQLVDFRRGGGGAEATFEVEEEVHGIRYLRTSLTFVAAEREP